MEEEEYKWRKAQIQAKIDFNKKIHCDLVAAKWEREMKELDKYYEKHKVNE